LPACHRLPGGGRDLEDLGQVAEQREAPQVPEVTPGGPVHVHDGERPGRPVDRLLKRLDRQGRVHGRHQAAADPLPDHGA
jgi:hypothetical protein